MKLPHAKTAIIGGTGFDSFSLGSAIASTTTPFGDTSAKLILSSIADNAVVLLARHGNPHTIAPHNINYRANIWALKQLGVERIFAINAVGGIRADIETGSIVIPDQLLDYTYGRKHTFYDGRDVGKSGSLLEHCDFSFPFCDKLRALLFEAAQNTAQAVIKQAVYAVTQGPRLETAAEINRLEKDGCDIVGMTAMPEAALARELDIRYVNISMVVNPAAGRGNALITLEEIHKVLKGSILKVHRLLDYCLSVPVDKS